MSLFRKKEPESYTFRGIELKCPVCGNKNFHTRRVLLNTSVATFFDFDWANRNATCFICSECTNILWFHGKD